MGSRSTRVTGLLLVASLVASGCIESGTAPKDDAEPTARAGISQEIVPTATPSSTMSAPASKALTCRCLGRDTRPAPMCVASSPLAMWPPADEPYRAAWEPLAKPKSLEFRTSHVDPKKATWDQLRYDEAVTRERGRLVYDIVLEPEDVDAFYQQRSNWLFLLGNAGEERTANYVDDCPGYVGGVQALQPDRGGGQ